MIDFKYYCVNSSIMNVMNYDNTNTKHQAHTKALWLLHHPSKLFYYIKESI